MHAPNEKKKTEGPDYLCSLTNPVSKVQSVFDQLQKERNILLVFIDAERMTGNYRGEVKVSILCEFSL